MRTLFRTTLVVFICIQFLTCAKKKETAKTTLNTDAKTESKINDILSKMSLEEKIGQTNLSGTLNPSQTLSGRLKDAVRKGHVGAVLNVVNIDDVNELQRIAINESPNGIPLIFSRDVIHGFKTIFPIPLGLAATWDTETARKSSEIASFEASSVGIRWTFAPLLDIGSDSHWGRITESSGEDPYLVSILGKAYVEGFQGNDLSNPTHMAACAKHYITYGTAMDGRDNLPEPTFRNMYLPPFKSVLGAGAATVMSSFNKLNGVPSNSTKFSLKDILTKQLNFNGLIASNWDSTKDMTSHGFALDDQHAAELSDISERDMRLNSSIYENHLKDLIEQGKISEKQIDEFVKNILRIKLKLNLFENPFVPKNHTGNLYAETHLKEAKNAAIKSSVLLKNKNILPLSKNTKVAVIGPLANKPQEQLGAWAFDGEKDHTVTPINAFNNTGVDFKFAEGLADNIDPSKGIKEAIRAAKRSDVILFFGGEETVVSDASHSTPINFPSKQEELLKALAKTGKPIVLIIMAGRPITITNIIDHVDAVLMAWQPGTMGGEALHDIIFGLSEPEGRLPISWPKTARKINNAPTAIGPRSNDNNSSDLDIEYGPHFPFGFGLGYTDFAYEDFQVSKDTIRFKEDLIVKVQVKNTGKRDGKDIAQLYIQDKAGTISKPVKALKRFKHVYLKSGEEKVVEFKISSEDLKFVNNKMADTAEVGNFNIWVGSNSASGEKKSFYLAK